MPLPWKSTVKSYAFVALNVCCDAEVQQAQRIGKFVLNPR
ncbi:hypothetical protein MC7420_602 [Coleofasciculus chthonoplastes PCC 7420]|uniref:Uncharacterized protein n=1 Tax=Coleofasciculus chthonoplastes PCC 7420 TaxID=118168 RepID=B4VL41_9CYAN|nr:hypothetical protein MC7420_602 [Coleofasciculus chthonoplastes PCC 7420]